MARSEDRLRRRLAAEIAPYRSILEALVSGDMSPGDFEMEFFAVWGDDDRSTPRDAFRVFEEFFFVVEDYVDNPDLRGTSERDLGPEELKERARELLHRAGIESPST